MRIRPAVRGLLLAMFLGVTTPGWSADFRINYAEPLNPLSTQPAADTDAQSAQQQPKLSFQAYGRQFDLELEPNTRLLNALPMPQKLALQRYEVYRGRIAGQRNSWVRLVRSGGSLQGALWDGTDLYTIALAPAARPHAAYPQDLGNSASVIYRLADTESDLAANFCGASKVSVNLTSREGYQQLVGELQTQLAAAELPLGQIEIAVIGDSPFRTFTSPDPQAALLARINIVDGIFSEQVGVTLVVPEIRILNASDDPFTTNNAEALLQQLATYRENNAPIRARGLAHLLTGRGLDSDIAGIAYLDSLCDAHSGVGLTEGWHDVTTSALIMAHELGHNFGAPHDGEQGSSCASTPPIWLMAANLNGSDTFSSCSLQNMAPRIAAAACITPAQVADVAVAVTPTTATGFTNQSVELHFDVSSIGTMAATDVVVTGQLNGLTVESIAVPQGSCTQGGGVVTCQLGSMPPGSTRTVTAQVRGSTPGTFSGSVTVSAANDRRTSNNTQPIQIVLDLGADVALTASQPVINGLTHTEIGYFITAASVGPQAAHDVVVRLQLASFLTFVSAAIDAANCDISSIVATCTIGTLAPGESRRIDVKVTAARSDSYQAIAFVQSSDDGNRFNDGAGLQVIVAPASDVTVAVIPAALTTEVGATFSYAADISAVGVAPSTDVSAIIGPPNSGVLESVTTVDGTCVQQGSGMRCSFGTLAPGTTRRIEMRARADQAGSQTASVLVQSSNNDNIRNDSAALQLTVKPSSDIGLMLQAPSSWNDFQPLVVRAQLTALGFGASTAVTLSTVVPDAFNVLTAQLAGGSCAVSDHTVTCTHPSIAANSRATVELELRATQVGNFRLNFTAGANTDANPDNNLQFVDLHIIEFHDVALQPLPAIVHGLTTEPLDIPIVLTASIHPLTNLHVNIRRLASTVVSATTQAGTCTVSNDLVNCVIPLLAASTSAQINLRLSRDTPVTLHGTASVDVISDWDNSNNASEFSVVFDKPADASANMGETTVAENQEFDMPFSVIIDSTLPVNDVRATISVPSAIAIVRLDMDGNECSIAPPGVSCVFGNMAGGSRKLGNLRLRSSSAGRFTLTLTVTAANDVNPQNNILSSAIIVNAAPSSSGGGGGGSFELGALAGLLAIWLYGFSRSRPASPWRPPASPALPALPAPCRRFRRAPWSPFSSPRASPAYRRAPLSGRR